MIRDKCRTCARRPSDDRLMCAYMFDQHQNMMVLLKCPYWRKEDPDDNEFSEQTSERVEDKARS